ncbi:hypothetical protein BDY24DRAFT_68251 [Mrakia frigida]|uniref:uncharacterized protein n=1 Tax=Mrakia frigida TaxID=29902 RepID=UPI003FCBFA5D
MLVDPFRSQLDQSPERMMHPLRTSRGRSGGGEEPGAGGRRGTLDEGDGEKKARDYSKGDGGGMAEQNLLMVMMLELQRLGWQPGGCSSTHHPSRLHAGASSSAAAAAGSGRAPHLQQAHHLSSPPTSTSSSSSSLAPTATTGSSSHSHPIVPIPHSTSHRKHDPSNPQSQPQSQSLPFPSPKSPLSSQTDLPSSLPSEPDLLVIPPILKSSIPDLDPVSISPLSKKQKRALVGGGRSRRTSLDSDVVVLEVVREEEESD